MILVMFSINVKDEKRVSVVSFPTLNLTSFGPFLILFFFVLHRHNNKLFYLQ